MSREAPETSANRPFPLVIRGSAVTLNSGMHGVSLNSKVYSDNIIPKVKS